MKKNKSLSLHLKLFFFTLSLLLSAVASPEDSRAKTNTKLHQQNYDIFLVEGSKDEKRVPIGSYSEGLWKEGDRFKLEYEMQLRFLDPGSVYSKKEETFVGYAKDDKNLTPISYELSSVLVPRNAKNKAQKVKVSAQRKDDQYVYLVKKESEGNEFTRPSNKNFILSSFLPLYLLKQEKGLSQGAEYTFQAIDESGAIFKKDQGPFVPSEGTAKIKSSEKLGPEVEAHRVEVSWGLFESIMWIKPNAQLAKMKTPKAKTLMLPKSD
jgi:hypothetical protein